MPQQHCQDSSSAPRTPSLSERLADEEYASFSEDEDKHRSYLASGSSLHSPSPSKQKGKYYRGRFFNKLLRIRRKRESSQGEQMKGLNPDHSGNEKTARKFSREKNRTSNLYLCVSRPEREESMKSRLDGERRDSDTERNGPRTERENSPSRRISSRKDYLTVESNSFSDQSQKTQRSLFTGSRLAVSGNESPATKRKVQIILVGDPGVGKSTFLQTLLKGEYQPSSKISNIISSHTKLTVTHAGRELELDIQDTGGQERFRSLTASYYRHAHGCLVFFNVNDKDSFSNVSGWLEDIRMYHSNTISPAVILVGLLHRPPRDRASFRRRSLRGDDIQAMAANSRSSSPRDSTAIDHALSEHSGGYGSTTHGDNLAVPKMPQRHHQPEPQSQPQPQNYRHDQHKHHQQAQHQIPDASIPSIILEPPQDGPMREIPREQAEHMAFSWGIPYREVDTRFDYESVMETVYSLLDLVVPDLAEIANSRLNSIVPGSSRKNSLNWSENHDRVAPLTCCLHC